MLNFMKSDIIKKTIIFLFTILVVIVYAYSNYKYGYVRGIILKVSGKGFECD